MIQRDSVRITLKTVTDRHLSVIIQQRHVYFQYRAMRPSELVSVFLMLVIEFTSNCIDIFEAHTLQALPAAGIIRCVEHTLLFFGLQNLSGLK